MQKCCMGNGLLWKTDVTEWDRISVDAYKFVIEQAKERLNEVIEESHAITKRGLTMLLTYLTVLSGLFGYIFSEKFRFNNTFLTSVLICMLAIFSLYVFTLLFALILPNDLYYRGSPPKETFFKEVFDGLTPEEGLKILMCNEVERIQDKIERINTLNRKRNNHYRSTLKISLIYIAITIFTLVKIIFNL